MLTGDTLLGGSSTVIVPDDGGSLGEDLQSLSILRAMAIDGRIGSIRPGQGVACESALDASEAIERAQAHRRERIEQVHRARTAGALPLGRLLSTVYGTELPRALEEAARWNLRATLEHLAEEG